MRYFINYVLILIFNPITYLVNQAGALPAGL